MEHGTFKTVRREPKVRGHLHTPIYAEQRRFLMPLFFIYTRKEADVLPSVI